MTATGRCTSVAGRFSRAASAGSRLPACADAQPHPIATTPSASATLTRGRASDGLRGRCNRGLGFDLQIAESLITHIQRHL